MKRTETFSSPTYVGHYLVEENSGRLVRSDPADVKEVDDFLKSNSILPSDTGYALFDGKVFVMQKLK